MGLLNFFKSPLERERDEIMGKMMDEIFPRGKVQVDKETYEIMSIIGYRFSKEELTKIYVHAAGIFFLAKDKSFERITKSMLLNSNGMLEKEDARKIYEYLMNKFNISPLQIEVNKMANVMTDSDKLFMAISGGIVELKNNYLGKELSENGKFEVLLFNSIIALNAYNKNHPALYDKTEGDFLNNLFNLLNN